MNVSRLSDMAIAVDYHTTKNLKPLMVISDVHWDSKDCDRKLLKKHLNSALEQDAAIIIIGDFFDLMEGRNDMRRSNTARAEHYAPNYLQKVVMDAAEWLQPYAKNIAMISNGNHETSVAKHTQVQPLTWLCYELRKQGSQVIEGEYQGFFVVRAAIMCVYERLWIVSKKSQVTMQPSSSGSDTCGKNAKHGPRPCTESNSV